MERKTPRLPVRRKLQSPVLGVMLALASAAISCTSKPTSAPESATAVASPTGSRTPGSRSATTAQRCVVIGSVSSDEGIVPFDVVFTAEGLCTSAAAIFVWDFGDDTPPVEAQNVSHRYDAPGNYVARVTIANAPDDVQDADEVWISVSPPTP